MEGDALSNTILQRKRKNLKVNKEEVLLMLRCYQAHPTNWTHIIDEMKENLNHLPDPVKELYATSAGKQLRDRLSNKFGKLMGEKKTQDDDIRTEIEAIRSLEKRLVVQSTSSKTPSSSANDAREVTLKEFSDSDEETKPTGSKPKEPSKKSTVRVISSTSGQDQDNSAQPALKGSRKRSLMDLVRENQMHYNRFITKKMPKLLKELGVCSDDSD